MKKIKLDLDYLSGPIWGEIYSIDLHKSITGIQVVDNDKVVQDLNTQIQDLFLSCYEFNKEGQTCLINNDKRLEIKPKMLELLTKLKTRLDEINNGTFEVEDLITPVYEKL